MYSIHLSVVRRFKSSKKKISNNKLQRKSLNHNFIFLKSPFFSSYYFKNIFLNKSFQLGFKLK